MKQLRPYQQEVLGKLKIKLRETDHPLLVNASVGSGKSLIIAELLRHVERGGYRALCLTMNSTLIRQNADTYTKQGGQAGIYCASLNMKDTGQPIIFASPLSVRGSIKKAHTLSRIPFNLIIVDECHNINFNEKDTTYMRIFNHYANYAQIVGHKLRFVGLTGTPYRGKGHAIIGENLFFKEEVCAITADWLIENTYLTPPVWGYCEKTLQYDFHELKINSMGRFNSTQLEEAIHKKPRLTGKIMAEVTEIVKNRKGAFIFASSVKHCQECAEWLPPHETAIITGETSDKLREHYIAQAKVGIIKYLVNVNVLCTGVDVPTFDTVVFVRPTESLVLYMQCLGRGLRLADGKTDCLILDYAGNLDRHGDMDNSIINKAIQPKSDNDPDYCIECFNCNTMNTLMSRRCIGSKEDKRCDHWFEWKDCPGCGTKNDIVSRQCRSCHTELIDPNRNLHNIASNKNKILLQVKETQYALSIVNGSPRFDIRYLIDSTFNQVVQENFLLSSEKAVRFFYHTIAKLHFMHPHQAYSRLQNIKFLKSIIENGELYSPKSIECVEMDNNRLKVVDKKFDHPIINPDLRQLDVIYTFIDFCKPKNTITFEYLVRENDKFSLIKDNYRLKIPTSAKRFAKNYGFITGTDVTTIENNQFNIETPSKIWVDVNNRMQRFVEDTRLIIAMERKNFLCSRENIHIVDWQWCEIVKIEVFNNQIAYDRNDKLFKSFRVQLYAYYKFDDKEGLVNIECQLSESDLDKVQSKQYKYVNIQRLGQFIIDINQWKTVEDRIFIKQDCINYRS